MVALNKKKEEHAKNIRHSKKVFNELTTYICYSSQIGLHDSPIHLKFNCVKLQFTVNMVKETHIQRPKKENENCK